MAAKPQLTLVIVGDGGVGKSSITLSFVRKEFNEEYDPTIEDSYTTDVTVDGTEWTVEVLDTAGQEEYRGLWGEQTVSQGDAFILTYSINSRQSFDALPDFLHTIRKVKHEDENPSSELTPKNTPFPFLIAGNKCDLPAEQREVSAAEGLAFAKAAGGLFVECSAKNGVNVAGLFESLIRSTARVRAAEKVHSRDPKMRGVAFNRNVGYLDELEQSQAAARAAGGGGSGIAFNEKKPPSSFPAAGGRNGDLAMDRKKSMSIGGLGRERRKSEEEGGGCCCVVA